MRLSALRHDHPDLAPSVQVEAQIHTVRHIGHDGTQSGMRRYAQILKKLHRELT